MHVVLGLEQFCIRLPCLMLQKQIAAESSAGSESVNQVTATCCDGDGQ
jgi:hypothetical protein